MRVALTPIKLAAITDSDKPRQKTIVSVQFLRFVAAASVVLFHAYNAIVLQFPDTAPSVVKYLFGFGAFGVHIFFCISGFVMTYTNFRTTICGSKVLGFITLRLIRIFPIYILCAITYVAIHYMINTPYNLSFPTAIKAFLLFPSDGSKIIGPAWTLSFELYFYFCFAVFMIKDFRRGLVAMSVFFGASVVLGHFLHRDSSFGIATNPLLFEFVSGAWAGYMVLKGGSKLRLMRLVLLVCGIIGYGMGTAIGYRSLPSVLMWGLPSFLVLLGALGYELADKIPTLVAKYSHLGDSSYFLYLSHVLIIDLLMLTPIRFTGHSALGGIILAILLCGICCVIAAYGYRFIERPLTQNLKRMAIPG